jgi:prevent-host-death family protein
VLSEGAIMGRPAIDLEADIKPVTDFRSNSAAMLAQVRDSGRPIILTQRGRSAAVVLDIRTYQSMVDELDELRDIARGIADADAGRVHEHDDARRMALEGLR